METSTSWQKLYKAAMLELDPTALHGRIEGACIAIREALEALGSDGTTEAKGKRQELTDALHTLQTLHRLELMPPRPVTGHPRPPAEG